MRRLACMGVFLSLAVGCAPHLGVDPDDVDRARIYYSWTGYWGTHSRFVELRRASDGDFVGTGQGLVAGGDLRALLQSVSSGVEQVEYADCNSGADNYPYWQISAWTEDDEPMVLESSSECHGYMPWNVYRGRTHWVIDDVSGPVGPALLRVVDGLWPDERFDEIEHEPDGAIEGRFSREGQPHNLLGMLPMRHRGLVAHEKAGPDFVRGLAFYLEPAEEVKDLLLTPDGGAPRPCEVLETDTAYPSLLYVSCPLDDLPETTPPQGYLRGTVTTEHDTTTLEGRVVGLEWSESPW